MHSALFAARRRSGSPRSARRRRRRRPPRSDPTHIVLVGDSTVTEGSGWGLGFRQLVAPSARASPTPRRTAAARRASATRATGRRRSRPRAHYYLIQFGHNDQPGKGPERETDPATTFPANMARYVDEVRGIGATPILVTSLVRRTFKEAEPATASRPGWCRRWGHGSRR